MIYLQYERRVKLTSIVYIQITNFILIYQLSSRLVYLLDIFMQVTQSMSILRHSKNNYKGILCKCVTSDFILSSC